VAPGHPEDHADALGSQEAHEVLGNSHGSTQ
jgi:hypothetical protein